MYGVPNIACFAVAFRRLLRRTIIYIIAENLAFNRFWVAMLQCCNVTLIEGDSFVSFPVNDRVLRWRLEIDHEVDTVADRNGHKMKTLQNLRISLFTATIHL